MAKTGVDNDIKTGVDLTGEKARRFEKLLGLFSEKDQNILINAPANEFSAFLEKGGFPSEELLDARESWLTHGGTAQNATRQTQDEEKEEKKEHKDSHENPELKEEKENPPTNKTIPEETKPTPEETPINKNSPRWGPDTKYSEPTPRSTIGRQSFSRESFTQRVPNFGIQRRTIGGINRGARSMRRVSGAGRGAAKGIAKKIGKKAVVQGLRLLLTTPIGWTIVGIAGLIILIIFIIFFFFQNPNTSPGSELTCDTGICYYLDGPEQVSNGEDICYQLTLIYDPVTATVPVNRISIYDDYPEDASVFKSATGVYTPLSPATEVVWQLSQNSSTSPGDTIPEGCNAPPPSVSPTTGQSAYYFKIKVTPTVTDTEFVNSVGVRVL